MKQIFSGVFKKGNVLLTRNLAPGKRVYDEKIFKINNSEYRTWDPYRSKLGAGIMCSMKNMPIKNGSKVLYLGASTGTTVSHVSDIVGRNGIIYAVEFAERVLRNLLTLCSNRPNICPIMADARKPENYWWVEEVDVVFTDIAQPDETEIALRNTEFLKDGGFLILSVKSQSIDVTKNPGTVFKEEAQKIKKAELTVLESIDIQKFEKGHCIIVAKKS